MTWEHETSTKTPLLGISSWECKSILNDDTCRASIRALCWGFCSILSTLEGNSSAVYKWCLLCILSQISCVFSSVNCMDDDVAMHPLDWCSEKNYELKSADNSNLCLNVYTIITFCQSSSFKILIQRTRITCEFIHMYLEKKNKDLLTMRLFETGSDSCACQSL